MAVDTALLENAVTAASTPWIRLYTWERPAVTIGRFQQLSRALTPAALADDDLGIARRPTGGRAVLHGWDLTIGIGLPLLDPILAGADTVAAQYRAVSVAFQAALGALGQGATIGSRRPGAESGDCFASASQADVVRVADGKKLVGAALWRHHGWLLLQASMPICTNQAYFEHAAATFGPGHWDGEISYAVGADEAARAVVAAFEREHAVEMVQRSLTLAETEQAEALEAAFRAR